MAVSICTTCGLCCDGTLFRSAALRADEVEPLVARGLRVHRRPSGEPALTQPCRMLDHTGCTVYEIRPHTCRAYRCTVLRRVEEGDLAEADALALIAAARDLRDRVVPGLVPFLDEDERRVLDETYRSVLRKFEPTSTLARRLLPETGEAHPGAEVFDVLPLRDLALRHPEAVAPDASGRSPFEAPSLALDAALERADDLEQILGAGHPEVLGARDAVAAWTGFDGRPLEALELHRALLGDRLRVLGPDHPDTLGSRQQVADWTGIGGEPLEALEQLRALVADRARVLGSDHPCTLDTRHSIAYWTGVCGTAAEARAAYAQLLSDRERAMGSDHPDTLATRAGLAHWTGMDGDPEAARTLASELLFDRVRVLGPSHRDSRASGRAVAYWTRVVDAGATPGQG